MKGEKVKKFLRLYPVRLIMVIISALLMAVALEMLLIPNNILDGGVTGISIMLSKALNLPMGVLIAVLSIPFLILGYREMGKRFLSLSIIGIATLSIATLILHHSEPFTSDLTLATVFGGALLGLGVGLAIRFGGVLDGTEILAVVLQRKTGISVSTSILMINIVIFTVAGFTLGWNQAMYSALTYYIATKLIDSVSEGSGEVKGIMVISSKSKEIAEILYSEMKIGSTFLMSYDRNEQNKRPVLYIACPRYEVNIIQDRIEELDSDAFITITTLTDVKGTGFEVKESH